MSRTGKRPVVLPEKVNVSMAGQTLTATGPLGNVKVLLHPLVTVEVAGQAHSTGSGQAITVKRKDDSKPARSAHGLVRALINNAVVGVSVGFTRGLEISGVGFRAEVKGSLLNLSLGFSHPVEYAIPQGIKITVQDQTKVFVAGSDRELVGKVASEIRKIKKPEPYKGKGIKYAGEHIIRKVGKTAAAAGAPAGGK